MAIILESFLVAPHPRVGQSWRHFLYFSDFQYVFWFILSRRGVAALRPQWLKNYYEVTLTQMLALFWESFAFIPLIPEAGACKNPVFLYFVSNSPKRLSEALGYCKWVLELNIQGCYICFLFYSPCHWFLQSTLHFIWLWRAFCRSVINVFPQVLCLPASHETLRATQ